jgi:Protein of unknown function (DUF3313)
MEQFNGFVRGFVLLALAGLLAGCAATSQARSVQTSGFLGDYSMLHEGKEGQALLVYQNPNTNWASYNKVMLDPVTVWMGADSKMADVSPEDQQRLADLLYVKVKDALQTDYKFVSAPGPGVLRLQVAITEADKPNAVMHTVSNIVPLMMILSQGKKLATGTQAFTGTASVEGKITDGATGQLLFAGVDKRGGGKGLARAVESGWADIEHAYDYWAHRLKYRLCQERGGANCIEPKE